MPVGNLFSEVLAVLKEEEEIPTKVSQRFLTACLVEVYGKLIKVESYIKSVDERLISVEHSLDTSSERETEIGKDVRWVVERIGLPVIMLVLGVILAYIFGG